MGLQNDVWKTEHKCSLKVQLALWRQLELSKYFNGQLTTINTYNNYMGDDESSSFNKVVQSKAYGETFIINKLQCAGHIQKCLGCRFRTLGQNYKGKKLSDDKGISSKDRLEDRAINLLQNYFGMAIRQNSDVPSMAKAIGAVLSS